MDVDMIDGVFIIKSSQNNVVEMLKEPNNFNELKKAFEFYGCKNIEIQQSEKIKTHEDNIELLNKFFNNEVIIKK